MKKAIIIGATSGIGKELAKLLTENGYLVGITGRRTELLTEIQKENPKLYRIRDFDITEIEKIETKLNELTEEIGGIDLLILSSGIGDINAELNFEIEKMQVACVCDFLIHVLNFRFCFALQPGSSRVGAGV